jgi:hypothetical protein
MSQPRRVQLIAKLAPRLWEIARVEQEDKLPSPTQVVAKDALFSLRALAEDPAIKAQIDGYLIDWYAVASYEARANMGANLGALVIRTVGPAAGKKLMSVTNTVLAPAGSANKKNRIGDELMLGMAVSQHPEAVKYVIDIARMDRGDPTLATRAMEQLHTAYVDPRQLFPTIVDPSPLAPNLDALAAIAKDQGMPAGAANRAIALIRMVGGDPCYEKLAEMINYPHPNPWYRYAIAQSALGCGGIKAIRPVVRAFPDGSYDREELFGAVAGEIARMKPREEVIAALREILGGGATVPTWIAIEALAAMKSAEDAPRIAAIKSSARLVGYWGPRKDRKEDPTLGQRAKELAVEVAKPAVAKSQPAK